MAASVDSVIADIILKNQLQIQRLASHEVNEMLKLLRQLAEELHKQTIIIDPTMPSQLRYRNERAAKLVNEGRELIGEQFTKMLEQLQGDMYELAELSYSDGIALLVGTIGIGRTNKSLSAKGIKALVDQSYINGGLLSQWFARAEQNYVIEFQKQIKLGMVSGESVDKMANRIIGRKRELNGEASLYEKQRRGTESLIRTAVMSVSNDARMAAFRENEDGIKGYQWVATLDLATCWICAVYDGRVWDTEGKPIGHEFEFKTPPIHANDRCVLMPLTTLDETPRPMKFEQWIDKQGAKAQEEWFGENRYKMWKDGKITFEDLITQKGRPLNLDELRALIPTDSRVTRLIRENTVIPKAKLTKYALDPESKWGKDKARLFNSALGYNLSNADELAEAILNGLEGAEKYYKNTTEYGDVFNAFMELTGPNGGTAWVRTGWILKPDSDKFSLTTAFVDSDYERKRQK